MRRESVIEARHRRLVLFHIGDEDARLGFGEELKSFVFARLEPAQAFDYDMAAVQQRLAQDSGEPPPPLIRIAAHRPPRLALGGAGSNFSPCSPLRNEPKP